MEDDKVKETVEAIFKVLDGCSYQFAREVIDEVKYEIETRTVIKAEKPNKEE